MATMHSDRAGGIGPVLDVWARRKWIALLVFAAVFGAVAAAAVSLPDLYRATADVIIEREQVSEAFVRPSVSAELETRIQTPAAGSFSRPGAAHTTRRKARLRLAADANTARPPGAISNTTITAMA